ncbi:hypothetical protein H072_5793 [Dactylellina haptotyla CBS 200.50]|uniref:Uncharacterized protein n=1 Tax=Dactylellina haptotyla (strain CBS 200.50) TaxID=1284197 RepID=S8AGV9_DACHA|nr:hypothetical protein H072_5793 [Dactylellina haptotyla CBS 200.50]
MLPIKVSALVGFLAAVVSAAPWDNRAMMANVFEDTINPRLWGPLHGKVITAAEGKIWVGRPTAASCAPNNLNCVPPQDTVIHVWLKTTMSMDAKVRQQLYVNSKGALIYTAPEAIMDGSITNGFGIKTGTFGGLYIMHSNGGKWIACPAKAGQEPYQVFFEQNPVADKSTPSGNRADCVDIAFSVQMFPGKLPAAYRYD